MRAATAYEKLKPLPHARLVALLSNKDRMVRDAARYHLVCRDTKAVQRDALKLCRSEQRLLREYGALILGELTLSESAIVERFLLCYAKWQYRIPAPVFEPGRFLLWRIDAIAGATARQCLRR